MGRVADRSKVTPKKSLARFADEPRSAIEEVIGAIEHALWLQHYRLPIAVEIFGPDEKVRMIRRIYEDAGYKVDLDSSIYPTTTIRIS